MLNDTRSSPPLQNVVTVGSAPSPLELNKAFPLPTRGSEDSSAETRCVSQTIQHGEPRPQLGSEWTTRFKPRVETQLNCCVWGLQDSAPCQSQTSYRTQPGNPWGTASMN